MSLRRTSAIFLTGLFLLTACSDGGGENQPPTGSGGSGGGSGIQIEKPENAIAGQYMFVLDEAKVTPDMVKTVAEALLAPHGGVLLDVYGGVMTGFAANGLDDEKALAMAEDPRVKGISQDYEVSVSNVQSNAPWGLDRIDSAPLDGNYDYILTGEGVHVYVVDTGIRATHQDFGGRVLAAEGADFVKDGKGTDDCQGHGTHVAGIIGGAKYGVAKAVQLHPVRVADCSGRSTGSKLVAGFDWIDQHGKKPAVVNVSMGGSKSTLVDGVVNHLLSNKWPVVAAAGNDGKDACNYSPGRVGGVFTVGATDKTDTRTSWSNLGSCVLLFAPGHQILSASHTSDTASVTESGTSMAAPHVTGVVAKFLEVAPEATPDILMDVLLKTATHNAVKNHTGSKELLSSRYVEPTAEFVGTKLWSTIYSDAEGWSGSSKYWQTIQYADLNGDKKMDVCGRAGDGLRCALSDGTSFGPPVQWTAAYGDGGGFDTLQSYWATLRFPDINGDGKADVCARASNGIVCGLSDGTKFVDVKYWDSYYTDASPWKDNPAYWATIQFVDINGDKKMDVCGRAANGVVCELSTGTAFGPPTPWATLFSDANGFAVADNLWGTIRFPDLNGDGKADVCGRHPAGYHCGLSDGTQFVDVKQWESYYTDAGPWDDSPAYWQTVSFADINGDKRMDICGRAPNGIVCELSTGAAFGEPQTWEPNFFSDATGWAGAPFYWGTLGFADLNGDGKADVCGRSGDGIACSVSAGTKFRWLQLWSKDYSDAANWSSDASYWATIRFVDVDGDGRADVCGRNKDGLLCGISPY